MNKVILIGRNHYNGLGLVRCFGMNGIKPYGIIIGKTKEKGMSLSKYWKETFLLAPAMKQFRFLKKSFHIKMRNL